MSESNDSHRDDASSSNPDPTVRQSNEQVGSEVGPYRLLELLGEGAMGEVWRAEQREPVKRIVALKLIRKGMDTREVVTRFEIERQALALMDHPWIAKVHDAGESESGRPFIAMEYVPGEPIGDYCRRHRLTIEQRLKLFQKVCQAVQHAHQKAVIHRDLKPRNILVVEVDGEPVPKVIDFGIAKATAQRLTDRSAATFVGQLIGTPLYMSPEQVEMSPAGVDTRADVYALGVILYELLAGALPFDPERLAEAAYDEVIRLLREEEPPRPSTRVSTLGDRTAEVAAQRGIDARKLIGALRGDLDWITLKALEKDRKRRYESPRDLADDLDRYLKHEPIEARPPSLAYRTSRFVRRHRPAVAVSLVAVLALIGFSVWQTLQSEMIARERDRALASERLALARVQVEKDPTVALAYAIASLEILDQPAARDAARQAIAAGPLRDELPRGGQSGNPITVACSSDGRRCVVPWSQSARPTVGIYDLEDYTMEVLTADAPGNAYQVEFNADGTHVVATGWFPGIHVWRVSDSAHQRFIPIVPEAPVGRLSFPSSDPSLIYVSTTTVERQIRWYEINIYSGAVRELGRSQGRHGSNVQHHRAAIDPDGEWVVEYAGTEIFRQRVDQFATGETVSLGRHPAVVSGVAADPELQMVASVDIEGRVRFWDLDAQGARLQREFRETAGDYNPVLDPYGPRAITTWGSETAHVYDLRSNPPRQPLRLLDRTHWVHDGAFLPDRSLMTGRNGISAPVARWKLETALAWSLDVGDSLGHHGVVCFSGDGATLYYWSGSGHLVEVGLLEEDDDSVRVLAQARVVQSGMVWGFLMDDSGERLALYTSDGTQVFDTVDGVLREGPAFDELHLLMALSPAGRRACYFDPEDDSGETGLLRVLDLETRRTVTTIDSGGSHLQSVCFDGEDALVVATATQVTRCDLRELGSAPDTLWTGPKNEWRAVLDGGRSLVVRGQNRHLTWVDLTDGVERKLGLTSIDYVIAWDHDPNLNLLVIGGFAATVEVFDLDRGERWAIPLLGQGRVTTGDVDIDPLGRWIVTQSGGIHAWRLPLDPIFGELPADAFLEEIRSRTNVRVVPDPGQSTGFRITNTHELAAAGDR